MAFNVLKALRSKSRMMKATDDDNENVPTTGSGEYEPLQNAGSTVAGGVSSTGGVVVNGAKGARKMINRGATASKDFITKYRKYILGLMFVILAGVGVMLMRKSSEEPVGTGVRGGAGAAFLKLPRPLVSKGPSPTMVALNDQRQRAAEFQAATDLQKMDKIL